MTDLTLSGHDGPAGNPSGLFVMEPHTLAGTDLTREERGVDVQKL
ncbi:hypothetical protein ABZ920_11045 [Streptomyces sp. NPDC046831]